MSEIELGTHCSLERLEHTHLMSLRETCTALATGEFSLPSLRYFLSTDPPPELFGPQAIFSKPPRGLTSLELILTAEFVPALRASPVFMQLRSLSLGDLDRATVDELIGDRTAFAELDLHLSGHVATSEERDVIVNLIRTSLPRAQVHWYAEDEHEYPDIPPAPEVDLAPLGDAIASFAQRLRQRNRR